MLKFKKVSDIIWPSHTTTGQKIYHQDGEHFYFDGKWKVFLTDEGLEYKRYVNPNIKS